jgi:hypothetical protein
LTVRSNEVRSGTPNCGANTWWKSVGDTEPSSAGERRQRPASYADAYTVVGLSGSSLIFVTPKLAAPPFQTSVNVAPPFVDS